MPVATQSLHTEGVLQAHIVERLVEDRGYELRSPSSDYDRGLAMDRELVRRFIETSQPAAWEKLRQHYPETEEAEFFRQLERNLQRRGLLDVLRSGIKIIPDIEFKLCFPEPASTLIPARVAEYEANILSVMREVSYSAKNANRIDIVLFLNGLPVATIEAKNLPTGTNFKHAEAQYCKDRSPAGEPLLTFKRGALVHFALDDNNVSMTTRLANGRTQFLPFNRGRDGGAGNPEVRDEFPIAYLYGRGEWGEAVFSRPVLLDIVTSFMLLEREKGKGKKAEKAIFPRFHQLDAVRKLAAHAKARGPGRNYLIQHSAGSGKTNTIAWLAHRAITLHDEEDRQVFDTAVVVTDRIVLDRSLQNAVGQFEQAKAKGVVRTIDGTSRQLREALEANASIIVTTIQKFSTHNLETIRNQSGRNFAVIVDEAHSSQSGKSAKALAEALTRGMVPEAEVNSSEEIEELIADLQRRRGSVPENISFFAFTATPRHVTLERFGVQDADGRPRAFHEYSMRQAIDEGFILDVLRNYTTYDAYYQLEKAIEDDPRLSGRRGQRSVARFAALHETAIAQKVEVIVEHFRRHVVGLLKGQARGMIVTQGREHALRYYFAVRNYLRDMGYDSLNALVAFSGAFDYEGEAYTEEGLNGFSEANLPSRFNGFRPDGTPYDETYQILIVAEKYQTGFDEPKLCALYIDRKLAGLQTVQTLSRLNRTHPDGKTTYILDFQNTAEDIREAFRPYFESVTIEEPTDPNQIYDIERRLLASGYFDADDLDRFAALFFRRNSGNRDRALIEGLIGEAVARVREDDDEGRQEEFRQLLRSYMRFYAFVSQIVQLGDTSLEKLDAYASWLEPLLPGRDRPEEIEITDDMLQLRAMRLELREEQYDASLRPGDGEELTPISDFGANPYTEEEQHALSEIVRAFNERHGTEFTDDDFIRYEPGYRETVDEEMTAKLLNNPADVVYDSFAEAFFRSTIRMFQRENEMRDIILSDAELRDMVTRFFFNRALREAKATEANE